MDYRVPPEYTHFTQRFHFKWKLISLPLLSRFVGEVSASPIFYGVARSWAFQSPLRLFSERSFQPNLPTAQHRSQFFTHYDNDCVLRLISLPVLLGLEDDVDPQLYYTKDDDAISQRNETRRQKTFTHKIVSHFSTSDMPKCQRRKGSENSRNIICRQMSVVDWYGNSYNKMVKFHSSPKTTRSLMFGVLHSRSISPLCSTVSVSVFYSLQLISSQRTWFWRRRNTTTASLWTRCATHKSQLSQNSDKMYTRNIVDFLELTIKSESVDKIQVWEFGKLLLLLPYSHSLEMERLW